MRSPLLDSLGRNRAGTGRPAFVAAPVKGWNTRDALAAMDPLYAPVLDNWFPRQGQIELRGGYSVWATGVTSGVKTLIQYAPVGGTNKLLACSDSGIFDATSGGAVGAAITPCTNGYWNQTIITNSAGTSYLWLANGVDAVKAWDGTTWSNPTLTGVTASTVNYPILFKHRIFFIVNHSLTLYFLDIDSFQGTPQQLPLGNLFRKGGYLVSGTSWTLDSGDGPDDLLVLISSEGQIAVFQGLSPTSASSWQLVGVWDVGKPLSQRCFFKLGGDVCAMLDTGVYPLSRLLRSGMINYSTAFTNPIQPTITGMLQTVPNTQQGWKGVVYPRFDAMIVNVPTQSTQWVMNTVTGALCSFSGWNATDLVIFNNILYWGDSSGRVLKAWDGTIVNDNGADITTTVHPAYQDFGRPTELKRIELFRLLLSYDGPIQEKYGMSVDFVDVVLNNTLLRTGSNPGTPWDTSPWDTSAWAPDITRQNSWRTVDHYPGYSLALWLQTASNAGKLYWSGTNYVLSSGYML